MKARHFTTALLFLILTNLASPGFGETHKAARAPASAQAPNLGQELPANPLHSVETGNSVAAEMHNVSYHFTDTIVVHIRFVNGELVPAKGSELPVFDDPESFVLHLRSAEIAISTTALADVLNHHVLVQKDAPIKGLSITPENDQLKVKGMLHDKGDIPFEAVGKLSATSDGKIRLHAEKVSALHLPVKGLMGLLGIKIADLIKTSKVQGIEAEEDDLILDPAQILPPPHIVGKVTAVQIQGNNVVQRFGDPREQWHPSVPGNYMAYKGNRLRFGKLTMDHTDMVLIDMNAQDPFDFYLTHYGEQLSAGYTKITPAFGLRVFMRDYDKLDKMRVRTASTK